MYINEEHFENVLLFEMVTRKGLQSEFTAYASLLVCVSAYGLTQTLCRISRGIVKTKIAVKREELGL